MTTKYYDTLGVLSRGTGMEEAQKEKGRFSFGSIGRKERCTLKRRTGVDGYVCLEGRCAKEPQNRCAGTCIVIQGQGVFIW